MPQPLSRQSFVAQELVTQHPPRLMHPNKVAVYRKACPPGATHAGTISATRWAEMDISGCQLHQTPPTTLELRTDFFGYEPATDATTLEWYLNFAHFEAFAFYGGALFAQDEMQVAEHPALASLREALGRTEFKTLTVEEHSPTPILVKGVERRCRVATEPNASAGRPYGLYGNNFARASMEVVEQATTPIVPPTISNILAIEAPAHGSGKYRQDELAYVLITAYTGFQAARLESKESNVVIHTGFWGCGAYGGNRVLMSLLQLLAARYAGIHRLVFHAGDARGEAPFQEAVEHLKTLESKSSAQPVHHLVAQIEAMGFAWGVGDGN